MDSLSKPEQVNILLVDDLKANLLALDGLLRRSDINIFKAKSGTEALEFMIEHEFALALIDVQMPVMNGFELAEFMRGMKKTKNIPIIFVTATAKNQNFSFKGYESGAVDFLSKPLDTFAVQSKVNIFIELYLQKKELKNQLAEIGKLKLTAEQDKAKLFSLFMEAPVGICVFEGPTHIFSLTNPAYIALISAEERKLIGKAVNDALPEIVDQGFIQLLDGVFKTGIPHIGKEQALQLQKTDGSIKKLYVDFIYHPKRDPAGNIDGIIVIATDVTEKVISRIDLEKAKTAAENANQFKSTFLANMSHEIRTPLGAILGFTDLLRDTGLSVTKRNDFIDIISRNGESLSVIINDVLDLSKVEAGYINLEFTDTQPNQIATDVVLLFAEKAKEKELTLEYLSAETTPKSIVSDPTRVRQILINLISNALKFTEIGSVKVKSYACKTDSGRPAVCFEICDTGIGISESQLENIFELFTQADETMTRRFGGTGLGLTLSRKLARSLGGDIVLKKTTAGKGSTFLLRIADQPERLTAKAALAPEEPRIFAYPQKNALQGVKVLVVDDSPDNQLLIMNYLTNFGALVESAENGEIGCQKALAGDYQIVLMDIQMPQMDGYTAARKLRAVGYKKPIIALTAHAMRDIRQKCLEAGYTTYLTRPINISELVASVVENLH